MISSPNQITAGAVRFGQPLLRVCEQALNVSGPRGRGRLFQVFKRTILLTALLGDLGEHHRQLDGLDPPVAGVRCRQRGLRELLRLVRLVEGHECEHLSAVHNEWKAGFRMFAREFQRAIHVSQRQGRVPREVQTVRNRAHVPELAAHVA